MTEEQNEDNLITFAVNEADYHKSITFLENYMSVLKDKLFALKQGDSLHDNQILIDVYTNELNRLKNHTDKLKEKFKI